MGRAAKTWRAWTRKEIDRLETLRVAARTAQQIADELGRSLPAIKCRLQLEGITQANRLAARWLPILSVPHTMKGAAAAAGASVWAVKQAKRKLRRAGFEIPAADRS